MSKEEKLKELKKELIKTVVAGIILIIFGIINLKTACDIDSGTYFGLSLIFVSSIIICILNSINYIIKDKKVM